MADEKIKFDTLQAVEDAIKKSSIDSDSKSTRLVVVLISQVWNPSALHMAKECEKLRSAKIPAIKSPILILDADNEKNKTWEQGVHSTPALSFNVGGKPLTIRRTGYADDDKFIGSCSKDNLLELFQSARTAENEGQTVISVDF